MNKEFTDPEAEILKLLTSKKTWVSTSRIAGFVGRQHQLTLTIMERLLKQGKVMRKLETLATYWKITPQAQ